MGRKQKRPGANRPQPERNAHHTGRPHSTRNRPSPADLPPALRGPFRQLTKAADTFISAGGYLLIEATWWTTDDRLSSAVLSDRNTAAAAVVVRALSEHDRETAVQA